MKAIIMAGGKGTRLRPVSEGYPKPMAPLLGRPVLEHIINLLRESKITEICLTLKHMPEKIIEYFGDGSAFGVRLEYRIEKTPLGTAGGVKACMDFVGDGDFLIISGDAVCDFDLEAFIREHQRVPSAVTMALYEHQEPLQYGTVLTNADGRVFRFIEKPEWERVVTDHVNTGIYIVSHSAMKLVPPDETYDFAKDLFPVLMAGGMPIRGVKLDGYWCDIGNPEAYRKCIMAALDGEIKLPPSYRAVSSETPAHPQAEIIPPVFLGPEVKIGKGAVIGPRVSIEGRSVVGSAARIASCVILDSSVGAGAELHGVIACPGADIPRGTRASRGMVIAREGAVMPSRSEAASDSSEMTARHRDPMDYSRIVSCSNRARLMRMLSESLQALGADFDNGLMLKTKKGDVRISPLADRTALIVETRSRSMEFSRELAFDFEEIIKNTEDTSTGPFLS